MRDDEYHINELRREAERQMLTARSALHVSPRELAWIIVAVVCLIFFVTILRG